MQPLALRILVALRDGPRDGQQILSRLREIGDESAPSIPTLYRHVRAGIDSGWIEVTGSLEQPGLGRPRQVFGLTDTGCRALEREARDLLGICRLALGDDATEAP